MPHVWPSDTDFALWELDVLDRDCPACGRMMHICDHRYRYFFTPDGPVELVCKLNHCPHPHCPGHARTRSPEVEPTIALPGWGIAWDVFCWIGHRRFARHWSIPQIRVDCTTASPSTSPSRGSTNTSAAPRRCSRHASKTPKPS